MALLLGLLARWPTVTFTLLYLMAGTGTVVTLTVLSDEETCRTGSRPRTTSSSPCRTSRSSSSAGSSTVSPSRGATLGCGTRGGRRRCLGTTLRAGVWQPNAAAAIAFGILVVIRASEGLSRRSDARRQVGLHRASQHMREIAIRHDVELHATARLHDTALSHLVAIAAAGSRPVGEDFVTASASIST